VLALTSIRPMVTVSSVCVEGWLGTRTGGAAAGCVLCGGSVLPSAGLTPVSVSRSRWAIAGTR